MAMKPDDISSLVGGLVKDCESYRDAMSNDRDREAEYYEGEMKDVPSVEGRSKVISRDVRATIKKVLPSVVRTILGNDKVVEYQPLAEGDEEGADQATDYVNYIVFPESNGRKAVKDAVNDALLHRNGVIRWWWDKKINVTVSTHTGLGEEAMVQLVSDQAVTVLEQSQEFEMQMTEDGPQQVTIYDLKLRHSKEAKRARVAAVPPEEFLIHPDTVDIDDGPITGIGKRLRRSDLVALGYDKEKIDAIPASSSGANQEDEESVRRRFVEETTDVAAKAMQEVDYYELYVRIDVDGDGIAELRRMVYAGGIMDKYLLENEEWDEVPFADIVAEDRPHQREGTSVSDDVMELQKIKTVLLRQTLDNIYWQNMPQPIVQEGTVANPEAVLNPKFGLPIRVNEGTSVANAVGFTQVPFVAQQSFGMLAYLDNELTDRTGVSDASSGLSPDALQNVTAKASAMIEASGIGQTELMVRTIAGGLVRVFKGLLRLTIKHQDKPRTVRLRDKWVEVDPRYWNADMDAVVNTGLGAGTRERDMMMMQMIIGVQKELLASLGPVDNPFVTADNLYNSITKQAEAAGINSPSQFFTKPDMDAIKAKQAQAVEKPDPAMEKMKAELALQEKKALADAENDRRKMEIDREIRLAEIQQDGVLKKYQIDQELQLRRTQNAAQLLAGEQIDATQIGGMAG